MKILYILKQGLDDTLKEIIKEHEKTSDVEIIDISEEKDYSRIVDSIESSDKVVSW